MSTPTNVRMLGWMRRATQASMMSRSGNMQIRADEAGEGHGSACVSAIMKGSDCAKTRSVPHADP